MNTRARAAIGAIGAPLFLFALNLWICWRLLRYEYIDQMPSIEGSFISLATYIERHWPTYDWFSIWYAGMPFARTYPPGLHYTVAIAAKMSGMSPASAYHAITGITYSLGAVTFYFLARTLGGSRVTAFAGALVFSLFSPSTLLLKAIRTDAGGFLNARRLQALVVYGEGPNVTGLMLAMLAISLLHRALRRRTPGSCLLAALALGAVPIVNWTATIGLLMGLTAYFLAGEGREMTGNLPRLILVGAVTAAIAFPFELPSTIRRTFFDAVSMDAGPARGAARWITILLLIVTLGVTRAVMIRRRVSFGARFAVLYFVVAAFVVLGAMWAGVRLVPLPERFHVAMEIPMVLTGMFAAAALCRKWPRTRAAIAVVLIVFCVGQAIHYRRYARGIIRRVDVTKTIEYQEAKWFDRNVHDGPVILPGSINFWLNAFTETPQVTGCCLQSLSTPVPLVGSFAIFAGYKDDATAADLAVTWLKAYAAQAVAIGGPKSREFYKDFKFPYRFQGRLPLLWNSGDDFIYRIPERAPGLARVVRTADFVQHPQLSGVDMTELGPFVKALDDSSLPIATFAWTDVNSAVVTSTMSAGQALSIAVTWDPGWTATANGRVVPVRADGLSLISIEPECAGPCEVRLRWSPGREPAITIAIALLTLAGMLVWGFVSRSSGGHQV